jgi:bifunctional ADP-heptose synthase (sugar kinase/adenylyltransferase)
LADLCVVVVNSDRFLCRKSGSKGFAFMSLEDRMEIISALLYVDVVTTWDAGGDDLTVCGALTILRPQIFAKGGDRTGPENIPEWGICQEIGCKVSVGIGGSKVRSSSELVKRGNI